MWFVDQCLMIGVWFVSRLVSCLFVVGCLRCAACCCLLFVGCAFDRLFLNVCLFSVNKARCSPFVDWCVVIRCLLFFVCWLM